jgi:hypothetical protein
MRKLILLALGGAAAAYAIKSRGEQPAPAAGPSASGHVPGPEPGAEAPIATEAATADTVETDAVVEGSGDEVETSEETEDQGR